ncbi:hypothetical protein A2W67_01490 [Candidatus Nomurabacteria bacterium RIFCSPLOWO2_02_40_28]|uniref:Uncharacterized protein n=2 Tax=Candidatus Nomuraibacteriota TaxID=1752729 RepID=A0A837I1Q6_9BACT|nr:MAG: hypothetical protein UT27_C0011G0005 [Candidatus Nomurabacteria bacterium GW2011_GWD2_39_12]KKR20617.1 MAG: hypothetical protein UT51_C0002G0052 [Candidatus Nomurabacteria bacterium GW2011_GWC2_39_41]KKR37454.1 MAG: hypothetical protein UT70_C0001G0130 [Candidatus Nomurabacteria bacterium GW2011_GWE2_40_10]KKR38702.1 MAG: hypothetical protein UT73_C0002G0187 [Candidatus Nomurabacteria bacterium GW2011_GWB1_40_11]KKR40427.1 MAG: hypothetical protein UT74_C0001G0161 [Parcubacteria group b
MSPLTVVSFFVLVVVTGIAIVITFPKLREKFDSIVFLAKVDPLAELKALMPELGLELRFRLESVLFLLEHTWHGDGLLAIGPFYDATTAWANKQVELRAILVKLLETRVDDRFDEVIEDISILDRHLGSTATRPAKEDLILCDSAFAKDFITRRASAMIGIIEKLESACQESQPTREFVLVRSH